MPDSWKLYYKTASGDWAEVQHPTQYGTLKGAANIVNFDPVKTTALKLEIVQGEYSAGVFEWSVK